MNPNSGYIQAHVVFRTIRHKHFFDSFQSGFLPLHSTETALVKVVSDLLHSGDSGSLFSHITKPQFTFESICHYVGVTGVAPPWFITYLSDSCISFSSLLFL